MEEGPRMSAQVGRIPTAVGSPGDRLQANAGHPRLRRQGHLHRPHGDIPDNEFTVIVGPNACGKSTLLRALARMLTPADGAVLLDGRAISSYPSKEVARRLGLLPQSSVAPDGITVADLVARGRYPHQRLLRQWSRTDEEIVSAVAGRDQRRRPGRPVRRRVVRRSAAAGLAGDGAGPADPDPAAGRADHLPGHRPPDRDAGPLRRSARASRAGRWSRCCTTSTTPAGTPPT